MIRIEQYGESSLFIVIKTECLYDRFTITYDGLLTRDGNIPEEADNEISVCCYTRDDLNKEVINEFKKVGLNPYIKNKIYGKEVTLNLNDFRKCFLMFKMTKSNVIRAE